MKTLIVEDDFTSRVVLQGVLSKYGDCHIAVNGTEAVEAFRSACKDGSGYDLICMDIMMPEMNGHEALNAIRTIEEQAAIVHADEWVKVIMTTGLDNIQSVMLSFEGLCDAYLVKPVNVSKLLAHLKSFGLVQ